jgi:pyruvate/2-oxoglutarate dehydrogenase complex dihydrolipoamide dehydrogenase (E3) component
MNYDFLIIGGGSAGYAAARTAVSLGLKTCVVDGAEELGGLCILRGCMPSKTLLESASRYATLRRAEEFGLRARALEVRGPEILARKQRLIGEFAAFRQGQLAGGKFELVRGHARFLDASTVEVKLRDGGTRQITAKSFLLATGSVVSDPPLSALNEIGCWTTDDALDSAEVPDSVIILGGGATAVEFATYYAGLGREVTLIQRSGQLLKGTDSDLASALAHGLRNRGVKVFTGTRIMGAERAGGLKRITFEHDGKWISAEAAQVLQALGRSPNVRGLELDAAGIRIANGRPATRATQQTNQPHIFAAGDVSGPFEVVHIAIQQGEVAARNAGRLISNQTEPLEESDYRLKLFAVFSDPEVAVVGRGETELRAAGVTFRTASYPFNDHGKSLCMGETDGFVKLIAATDGGEILGGACVGPHAAELIHEIVVAMRFRATAAQLAETPHYHPTLSEIWTYPAEELAG